MEIINGILIFFQKEDVQDSRKEARLSKKKLESERKKIKRESDVSP